jgi:hypothetical protein
MRDKKLVSLILLVVALNLGHSTDHICRGDLPLPLSADSVPFIAVSLAIYAFIGLGLFLYWRGKVGPRFWMIFGSLGFAFGWLGHFSPFTDQPPSYILAAYNYSPAGWLAIGDLVALMLVLLGATLYAGYLWRRAR